MTATTPLSTARRNFAQRIAATLAADPHFQADWAVYRALSIAGGDSAGLRLMLADAPSPPAGVLGMDPPNPFQYSDVLADVNGGGGGDAGPDPGFPGGEPDGGYPGGGDGGAPFPTEPGGNDPRHPPGPPFTPFNPFNPFNPFKPDMPDLTHPWPTYPVGIHVLGHPPRD
jgi:hypothetical protein